MRIHYSQFYTLRSEPAEISLYSMQVRYIFVLKSESTGKYWSPLEENPNRVGISRKIDFLYNLSLINLTIVFRWILSRPLLVSHFASPNQKRRCSSRELEMLHCWCIQEWVGRLIDSGEVLLLRWRLVLLFWLISLLQRLLCCWGTRLLPTGKLSQLTHSEEASPGEFTFQLHRLNRVVKLFIGLSTAEAVSSHWREHNASSSDSAKREGRYSHPLISIHWILLTAPESALITDSSHSKQESRKSTEWGS